MLLKSKKILITLSTVLLLVGIMPQVARAESSGIAKYQVKDGDSLYEIAKANGASVSLIAAMNNLPEEGVLRLGQTLVLPRDPEINVTVQKGDTVWAIAQRYQVPESTVLNYNHVGNSGALQVGSRLLIPAANLAEEPQSVSVLAAAANRSFTVQKRSVTVTASRGNSGGSGQGWALPVLGTVSSDFGNRKSGFHHGIDIAAAKGSPIKAAAAGKVVQAGYKSSIYGNSVTLEHAGGYITMYAHMSKVKVKEGARVKAGQTLGLVGETGNATGPHLHFQISRHGKIMNPNSFIKFR